MPHYIEKCQHGIVVSQCRCFDLNKSVVIVTCPESCKQINPSVAPASDKFVEAWLYDIQDIDPKEFLDDVTVEDVKSLLIRILQDKEKLGK